MEIEPILESVRSGRGLGVPGSPMEIIPSCLRGAFRAPAGQQFCAADYSQIELRVLAWLTGCRPMLDAFLADRDLYIEFAAKMYAVPYAEVTKAQRQVAKPAVLSCGYGTGGGKIVIDKNDDEVKTGLYGYAESMGVDMSLEDAWGAVEIYRTSYPEVPRFWYAIEDQVRGLVANNHAFAYFSPLALQYVPGKLLAITLPSGRRLHYLKPSFDGRNVEFDCINATTKKMERRRLYGSLLTENLVQAIARDIMAVGMLRVNDAGFEIVAHTHDEILTLTAESSSLSLDQLREIMTQPVDWAPGLPLSADGFTGEVYRK